MPLALSPYLSELLRSREVLARAPFARKMFGRVLLRSSLLRRSFGDAVIASKPLSALPPSSLPLPCLANAKDAKERLELLVKKSLVPAAHSFQLELFGTCAVFHHLNANEPRIVLGSSLSPITCLVYLRSDILTSPCKSFSETFLRLGSEDSLQCEASGRIATTLAREANSDRI
jgi:hypothetical protein